MLYFRWIIFEVNASHEMSGLIISEKSEQYQEKKKKKKSKNQNVFLQLW